MAYPFYHLDFSERTNGLMDISLVGNEFLGAPVVWEPAQDGESLENLFGDLQTKKVRLG